MLNSDDFIKRLEYLLDFYSLSASSFADKIGVQRSSISHLLSGRNKPSLDFVMKILEEFPDVNLYWILNGKGGFLKTGAVLEVPENLPESVSPPKKEENQIEAMAPATPNPSSAPLRFPDNDADIDRIAIFYNDGTFKDYLKR